MSTLLNHLIIIVFLTLIYCNSVIAESIPENEESLRNVQFVRNYDGDTITFNIPNTPAIIGKNIAIRLRGIDTPELKKNNCQEEKEKAETAKQLVYSLLKDAMVINLHRIDRGKYFRILADVEFDDQDLASILLEKNLAVNYSGGKKEFNWCRDSAAKITGNPHSRSVIPPKISGVYIWPPPPVQKDEKTNDTK